MARKLCVQIALCSPIEIPSENIGSPVEKICFGILDRHVLAQSHPPKRRLIIMSAVVVRKFCMAQNLMFLHVGAPVQ